MGTKITKNKPTQTTGNDKIQITMVWKKIHTNTKILPIQPTMQHLRIQKTQPNIRHKKMDMSSLWNNPPQRHKRSKKHTTKSNKKYIIKKKINIKIIFEPVSQQGIAW